MGIISSGAETGAHMAEVKAKQNACAQGTKGEREALRGALFKRLDTAHEHPCFVLAPTFCGQGQLIQDYLARYTTPCILDQFLVDEQGSLCAPPAKALDSLAPGMLNEFSEDQAHRGKHSAGELVRLPGEPVGHTEDGRVRAKLSNSADIPTKRRYALVLIGQWLEDDAVHVFSEELDALLEDGWYTVVLCSIQNDRFEELQSDRAEISAHELMHAGFFAQQDHLKCFRQFMQEFLPVQLRLAAVFAALLTDTSLEELERLGYELSSDVPDLLATLNPLFTTTCDETGLTSVPFDPISIKDDLISALHEYLQERGLVASVSAIASRITALSILLLERGDLETSHQVIAIAEELIASEVISERSACSQSRTMHLLANAQRQHHEGPAQGARIASASQGQPRAKRPQHQPLYLQLFGKLEVYKDGVPLVNKYLSRTKVRRMLAYLALNQYRATSRDQIINYLWPYLDFERAQKNLYTSWCMLAKGLGSKRVKECPYIIRDGEVYQLNPEMVFCDTQHFEDTARNILFEKLDWSEQTEALLELESSYKNTLVADVPSDSFISMKRESYRSLMVDTLLLSIRQLRERGELERALYYARAAYDLDETREDVYRELMDTQFVAGQRTSAMQTYFSCKRYLSDELGILPSRSTTALYQDVLLDSCG